MDDFDNLMTWMQGSKAVVQAAAERGVYRAGLLVEGDAKRLCPVDTGRLRSSITTEIKYGRNNPIASVGTNVEYAPYVEFGTGERGDQSVDHRIDWLGQPPHPYLRPALAFNEKNGNIEKIISFEVGKVLK